MYIYIYILQYLIICVLNVKIILCVVLHKEDKLYILNASLIVIFCKIHMIYNTLTINLIL